MAQPTMPEPSAAPEFLAGGGELGALMRAHDWAATSLGPPERWPQSLKTCVRIMLTSRQPMFVWWGDALINLYNDAYKSIVGGKHPAALGQPAQVVWREIWDQVGPRAESAMRRNEGTYDEALLLVMERYGYKEETYYTFSYSPVPGDHGETGGIICANTDDTARIIGERQLALLRDLAAATADARTVEEACRRSAEGIAADAKDLPFALIYLGREEGGPLKLCARIGMDAGHPAAPEIMDATWPAAAALETNQPVLVEGLAGRFAPHPLPTGGWSDPPTRAVVLPIAQSGHPGVLAVGLNPYRLYESGYESFLGLVAAQVSAAIANARAYEEERARAEALAEIDRAKTAFFSNVSHEFRTPLTLMLGPLEDAMAKLDGQVRDDALALIETAHRNGLRLLRLVNTLLDFSRIEAGRMGAAFEPTDLARYTAELASSFRSACERAGLALIIDCPPLPETVHVDRDHWEKIVLNLLSNAFKYTFDGAITVQLRASEAGAVLSVADTGTGIAAEELPRLFERFHRVEAARGRSFEGSGIGLALVRELVRLHGGDIAVQSEPGHGSTFTVTLPFGTEHLPPGRIRTPSTAAPAPSRAQAFVEEALRWLPEPGTLPSGSVPLVVDSAEAAPDMPRASGHILLADDNADMREYVRRLLADRGYLVEVVADGEAALAAARRAPPDLVLSDVMMPRLDGFGLLAALRAEPGFGDRPVILLSARAGEEARVEGLAAGADDYLTKPFSARELLARVSSNLAAARARREAAAALQARSDELATLLATAPIAVLFTNEPNPREVYYNRQAAELLRLTPEGRYALAPEGAPRPSGFTVWRGGEEASPETYPLHRALRGEEVRGDEHELRFPDGTSCVLLASAAPVRDAEGRVRGAISAAIDITDRKRAETELQRLTETLEQRVATRTAELAAANSALLAQIEERERVEATLRQMQRLEAVGQLTSGVAHDFNNLLTVILGNIEFLARAPAIVADERLSRRLAMARQAADRGATLTAQLLAFSRRQRLEPKPTDLNETVGAMHDLLRSSMGGAVRIETALAPDLWPALVDGTQIELTILNLAINARDAMPEGGVLRIETANVRIATAGARPGEPGPGDYVTITVRDTGMGMTDEVRAKAFEPFFTTKETGKGSGLGLPQVLGFAQQSGGGVRLETAPGAGTAVTVFLPRALEARAPAPTELRGEPLPAAQRQAVILLVDDDDAVREVTAAALEDAGFDVREAGSGGAALAIIDSGTAIDLLLVDFAMPGMNGAELARQVAARRAGLPVLFITGYADAAALGEIGRERIVQKPFRNADLQARIAAALGGQ